MTAPDPVGHDGNDPGADRDVGQRGVERVPEQEGPVEQILQHPAGRSEHPVHAPDQPLYRVAHALHPALAPDQVVHPGSHGAGVRSCLRSPAAEYFEISHRRLQSRAPRGLRRFEDQSAE